MVAVSGVEQGQRCKLRNPLQKSKFFGCDGATRGVYDKNVLKKRLRFTEEMLNLVD